MKVLMIARKTLNTSPGGDTVQINSTAKFLRELNVEVDISIAQEDVDYSQYDLLHFFNIIRPDDILPHILKTSIPYLVSTIFVDYNEYERSRKGIFGVVAKVLDADRLEFIKALARFFKNGDKINSSYYLLNGHRKSIQYVASKARLLLPNSNNEYDRLVRSYGIKSPYRKVVNAIDSSIFKININPNHLYKDHVLCIGRIEGRKNQLNLLKAMVGSKIPITIIGKASPNHMEYFKECMRLISANSNMNYIDHIDHEELGAIYKAARVHVLPSWFETTGLSSLEAGLMECNVVVTRKGDTVEYFGDHAIYCEPDDVDSIRNAVYTAYNTPFNVRLREKILREFTWQDTAYQTYEAYKEVISLGK